MIITNNLKMTYYESEDYVDLYELIADKSLTYPAGFKPVPDMKTCVLSLQYRIMSKQYVKILSKDNKFMGEINFYKDQSKKNPNAYEIGFILLPRYQGFGYMQEALKAFIIWFNSKVDIDILTMHAFVGNSRSENTIRNLGFNYDGIIRRYKKMYDSNVLDVLEFSLTKEELERKIELWQKY